MYIRFKTDASVNNHGFEAAYGSALEGKKSIFIQYGSTAFNKHDSATFDERQIYYSLFPSLSL